MAELRGLVRRRPGGWRDRLEPARRRAGYRDRPGGGEILGPAGLVRRVARPGARDAATPDAAGSRRAAALASPDRAIPTTTVSRTAPMRPTFLAACLAQRSRPRSRRRAPPRAADAIRAFAAEQSPLCTELGGAPPIGPAFATAVDLNGDARLDYVVDLAGIECRGAWSAFCGSAAARCRSGSPGRRATRAGLGRVRPGLAVRRSTPRAVDAGGRPSPDRRCPGRTRARRPAPERLDVRRGAGPRRRMRRAGRPRTGRRRGRRGRPAPAPRTSPAEALARPRASPAGPCGRCRDRHAGGGGGTGPGAVATPWRRSACRARRLLAVGSARRRRPRPPRSLSAFTGAASRSRPRAARPAPVVR